MRGTIYDRSGTVVLATTVQRDRLVAYPAQLTGDTPAATAERRRSVGATLVRILGLGTTDGADLRAKLASGKAYVVLARDLDADQLERSVQAAIDDGTLREVAPGARAGPRLPAGRRCPGHVARGPPPRLRQPRRCRPVRGRGPLAGGRSAGAPQVVARRARRGRAARSSRRREVVEPGSAGRRRSPSRSTPSLQLALEQEVYAAWVADRAKSVSAVVMDPATGEILRRRRPTPRYDANDYPAVASADPARFLDPVVSAVYEPGSVFKMLTAAAALEAGDGDAERRGSRDPATLALDDGRASVSRTPTGERWGCLTFEDAVA